VHRPVLPVNNAALERPSRTPSTCTVLTEMKGELFLWYAAKPYGHARAAIKALTSFSSPSRG